MNKGFTLLELMVVIIIIGVLATLGVMQYQASIEKSRGAEARQIMGQLRSQCAAIYMAEGAATNCTTGNLRMGEEADRIPTVCRATHYFSYGVTPTATGITIVATRCTEDGKAPDSTTGGTLTLATNYVNGTDGWTSTGGY